MQDMTTCASCHQVSQNGHLISMELNFRGDSGAQLIAPVKSTIALSADHFMTWSDFPKPDLLPRTRGVFAKLSPQGNYLVGTVSELLSIPSERKSTLRLLSTWHPYASLQKKYLTEPNPDDILNRCRDDNCTDIKFAW